MTQLTKTEKSGGKIDFTPEHIQLIKNQIARGATDDELSLFLYHCKRTGLDPLTRQIHFIKRKIGSEYRMTIQTSIDGFRVIAERTGNYGGQEEPEFINDSQGNLLLSKVPVYKFRGDMRYLASVGVAYWSEYCPVPGQDFMWKKMPHTMLSKVAEAIALRKAYPQDLSGLYTDEEMAQADGQEDAAIIPLQIISDPIPDPALILRIDSCATITELTHLYNDNRELFDANIGFKLKLTERKNYLKGLNTQTA